MDGQEEDGVDELEDVVHGGRHGRLQDGADGGEGQAGRDGRARHAADVAAALHDAQVLVKDDVVGEHLAQVGGPAITGNCQRRPAITGNCQRRPAITGNCQRRCGRGTPGTGRGTCNHR